MPKLLSLTEWVWIKRICNLGDTALFIMVFFPCDNGHKSRVSQNLRVPEALRVSHGAPGVRVLYFLLLSVCQFLFVSSQWLLWRKVTISKRGSSFVLKYEGQFNLKSSFCILCFCGYVRFISFFSFHDLITRWHCYFLFDGSASCSVFDQPSQNFQSYHHLNSSFWIYV